MRKILVLGYFGYLSNQIDGQTIKTRSIYSLLYQNAQNAHIIYFDTQQFQKSKIRLLSLIRLLCKIDIVIYLPGKKNLKFISPIVFFLSKLLKYKTIYPVIGGWLSEYIENRKYLQNNLQKVEAVLVESSALQKRLEMNYNFTNVVLFPNFRIHNFKPLGIEEHAEVRLVFMARIMKEKGCDLIFDYIHYYQNSHINIPISVSFYGPIISEYETDFNRKLLEYGDYAHYYGVIDPINVYEVLSKQDILLLPTFYEGEGFPGSIIDAYIAGLPVIASRWKDLPEFVDEGLSGFTFDLNRKKDFFYAFNSLILDPILLHKMKIYALKKSKSYSAESAWKILKQYL